MDSVPGFDAKLITQETSPEININSEKISSCTTFDELYSELDAIRIVEGSRKKYSALELRKNIEQVRHGHLDISYITNTHRIRTVVEGLLTSDAIYKKYVLKKEQK